MRVNMQMVGVAGLLAGALMLGGCGGSDSDSSTTTTTAAVTTTTAPGGSTTTTTVSGETTTTTTATTTTTLPTVVSVTGAGSANAAGADVTYNISVGDYLYTIDGFGAGDKLVFPAVNTPTIFNNDFTDEKVDVKYSEGSGNVITIRLTGLTEAQDRAIVGRTSFNQVFGAGSL